MTDRELALYLPDGYVDPPTNPYGRHVANAGTYRALVRYGDFDRIHVQCRVPPAPELMAAALHRRSGGPRITTGPLLTTDEATAAGTQLYGQAYLSQPAWIRRAAGRDDAYSIVGTMFAFASATHREQMMQSTLAPIREWDAVICSSPTLVETISGVYDSWEEHLREHMGASLVLPRPQLPVIPFGGNVASLAERGHDPGTRDETRAQWGVGPDDVVVFSLGRLSYYDKAFPQATFRAVAETRNRTGRRIHLVMAGWFPDGEADRHRYQQAALHHAPDVPVMFLDGNDQEVVTRCWAAADVFMLLSDTILETFGQALVEAMAVGLPLVVSDWDGYRFIVRDGIDGYLIPTLGAAPGRLGEVLAMLQYVGDLGYSRYAGAVAQHTAVNVPATVTALSALVESAELRARMGAAGQGAARDRFDWPVVTARYLELFEELADRRRGHGDTARAQRVNPLRSDPFGDFATLPSKVIDDDVVVRRTQSDGPELGVELDMMFPGLRGTPEEAAQVLDLIEEHGDLAVGEVLRRFPRHRRPFVRNTVCWLAKSGAIDWR